MLTDRQRDERRVALRALIASAFAVVVTVSATHGITSDPTPRTPQDIVFVAR